MTIYTTTAAARLLNIAPSSIRNYTTDERLRRHFSATATPERNTARQLTDADLRTLRFIAAQTRAGRTLDQVASALDLGELDTFSEEPEERQEPPQNTALAVIQSLSTALAEQRSRETELTERLLAAEAKAARLEAELAARKQPFWKRLFG